MVSLDPADQNQDALVSLMNLKSFESLAVPMAGPGLWSQSEDTQRNLPLHSAPGRALLPFLVRSFGNISFRSHDHHPPAAPGASSWQAFCEWVTSTNNRLYVGWFGVLMIPTLLAATICFVIAFVAAPPVDIDGIREPVAGSLITATTSSLYCGSSITPSACTSTPSAAASSMSSCTTAAPSSWLFSILIGIYAYMGREWNSPTAWACALICVAYSAPVAAASAVSWFTLRSGFFL